MGREARENAFEKSQQKPPADAPITQTAMARQKAVNWARFVSPIAQNIMYAWVGNQGMLVDLTPEDREKLADAAIALADVFAARLDHAHEAKEAKENEVLDERLKAAGLVAPDMEMVKDHLPPGTLEPRL